MWATTLPISHGPPQPTAPAGQVPTDADVQAASLYASHAKRRCILQADAPQLRAALVFEAQVVSAAAAAVVPPLLAGQGAAPAQGLVIPVGTPPWAASLLTHLKEVKDSIGEMKDSIGEMKDSIGEVKDNVDKLLNRTARGRKHALDYNARAGNDSSLMPVPHPDTGMLPPPNSFPANVTALRAMLAVPIDSLLEFYDVPRQGTVAQRHHELAQEIGCGHLC